MAYKGNTENHPFGLIYSNANAYVLSAGAQETVVNETLGSVLTQQGDTLRIIVSGTTAGNANAKDIEIEVTSGSVITFNNSTTLIPNGLDWIAILEITGNNSGVGIYKGRVSFDGIADEIESGSSVLVAGGSLIVTVKITGVAASDVTVHSTQIYVYNQEA